MNTFNTQTRFFEFEEVIGFHRTYIVENNDKSENSGEDEDNKSSDK